MTALVLGLSGAAAQDYPARAIHVIVASGAGGIGDLLMRSLGDRLTRIVNQPVVIENRPGGSFNIATKACAEARPDGYTVCLLPGEPVTYNQYLFKNLQFDPDKDVVPVTHLFNLTQVLAINSTLGVKTLAQLAAYSKEKAGTLSYTAPALSHAMFIESFKKDTGADLVRVPFKGGGDAITGMLSNSTPVLFLGLGNVLSFIQAGTATAIAVDGEKRSPLVPDVPTLRELGYRGDIVRSYMGLFAPKGTPPAIIKKLYEDVAIVLRDPEFQAQHLRQAIEMVASPPDEFQAFIRLDRQAAERVVKASGMTPQ